MALTSNPDDPRIQRGHDSAPRDQHDTYLVLSEEERAKGFVRPVRQKYVHRACSSGKDYPVTKMGRELAETWARNPKFYGGTYCVHCRMHRPVAEFVWRDTDEVLGSDLPEQPAFT